MPDSGAGYTFNWHARTADVVDAATETSPPSTTSSRFSSSSEISERLEATQLRLSSLNDQAKQRRKSIFDVQSRISAKRRERNALRLQIKTHLDTMDHSRTEYETWVQANAAKTIHFAEGVCDRLTTIRDSTLPFEDEDIRNSVAVLSEEVHMCKCHPGLVGWAVPPTPASAYFTPPQTPAEIVKSPLIAPFTSKPRPPPITLHVGGEDTSGYTVKFAVEEADFDAMDRSAFCLVRGDDSALRVEVARGEKKGAAVANGKLNATHDSNLDPPSPTSTISSFSSTDEAYQMFVETASRRPLHPPIPPAPTSPALVSGFAAHLANWFKKLEADQLRQRFTRTRVTQRLRDAEAKLKPTNSAAYERMVRDATTKLDRRWSRLEERRSEYQVAVDAANALINDAIHSSNPTSPFAPTFSHGAKLDVKGKGKWKSKRDEARAKLSISTGSVSLRSAAAAPMYSNSAPSGMLSRSATPTVVSSPRPLILSGGPSRPSSSRPSSATHRRAVSLFTPGASSTVPSTPVAYRHAYPTYKAAAPGSQLTTNNTSTTTAEPDPDESFVSDTSESFMVPGSPSPTMDTGFSLGPAPRGHQRRGFPSVTEGGTVRMPSTIVAPVPVRRATSPLRRTFFPDEDEESGAAGRFSLDHAEAQFVSTTPTTSPR